MIVEKNWNPPHFFHLDVLLLCGLVAVSVLGLVVLYSAGGQNMDLVIRQLIRMGLGFGIMFALAQIPIAYYARWIPWMYGIGLLLLVAVLLVGQTVNGSQRWLNLVVFRFQPSEMLKLIVPLMVAWYLADKPLPPNYGRLSIALGLIALPVLLVAKQPDLGTSLLIASSGMFVVFFSGLYWRLILGFIILVALSLYPLWNYWMHDYQKQRVLTLFNPEENRLSSGYHIIQSKIAIGSGGVDGKGWMNGTQSHLEFLPERTTDFIFAVYSEEQGLIGVIVLLCIYLFILTRGLIIAIQAQDSFGRLLAGSIVMTLFIYIFVNMGMVSGILPVVGLPLPFLSYGGTSLVTMMASFGLLMSVHTHRRLLL